MILPAETHHFRRVIAAPYSTINPSVTLPSTVEPTLHKNATDILNDNYLLPRQVLQQCVCICSALEWATLLIPPRRVSCIFANYNGIRIRPPDYGECNQTSLWLALGEIGIITIGHPFGFLDKGIHLLGPL